MRSSHNNPHAHFFSSIKQVEKRLKLENNHHSNTSSPSFNLTPLPTQHNSSPSQSLSSPIYLNFDQPTSTTSNVQESEPPQEFLSKSLDFPETQKDPPQESIPKQNPEKRFNLFEADGIDDIECLMQLLGLQKCKDDDRESDGLDLNSVCDDGFYGNVVRVKGPKCKKEVERLEGWIKHFMNGSEKKEAFILGHLLLAKAALSSNGAEGFEFPSTVNEFLQNDPPQK